MVKSVRASFLSAQKFGTRSRGRPLLSNAGRRARTPTLMPGRSLTRPCPGTGTPPSQFVSGLSACLSLQRARFHPPPRSNVAVAGNPSLRSNVFYARCRRHNLAPAGLDLELALRARRGHRVCRLLVELRPRLARSSAKQSDRPAVADGRVCWSASSDPRACAARTIAGMAGEVGPDSTT
jgi:hypothetical protein